LSPCVFWSAYSGCSPPRSRLSQTATASNADAPFSSSWRTNQMPNCRESGGHSHSSNEIQSCCNAHVCSFPCAMRSSNAFALGEWISTGGWARGFAGGWGRDADVRPSEISLRRCASLQDMAQHAPDDSSSSSASCFGRDFADYGSADFMVLHYTKERPACLLILIARLDSHRNKCRA
jgi:hypothetical protein